MGHPPGVHRGGKEERQEPENREAWKRALTVPAAEALLKYVADVPRGMRAGVPAWQMKACKKLLATTEAGRNGSSWTKQKSETAARGSEWMSHSGSRSGWRSGSAPGHGSKNPAKLKPNDRTAAKAERSPLKRRRQVRQSVQDPPLDSDDELNSWGAWKRNAQA